MHPFSIEFHLALACMVVSTVSSRMTSSEKLASRKMYTQDVLDSQTIYDMSTKNYINE